MKHFISILLFILIYKQQLNIFLFTLSILYLTQVHIVYGILAYLLFFNNKDQKEHFQDFFDLSKQQKDLEDKVKKISSRVEKITEYYKNMDKETPLLNSVDFKDII